MMRVRVFLWQVKASVKSSFINVITFKNIDDIVKKYCFFKKIYSGFKTCYQSVEGSYGLKALMPTSAKSPLKN